MVRNCPLIRTRVPESSTSKRTVPPTCGSTVTSRTRTGRGHIHSCNDSRSSHSSNTDFRRSGHDALHANGRRFGHRARPFLRSRADSASARVDQNSVCSDIHCWAIVNPSGCRESQCSRPRTSRRTSPAASNTPMWRETPANVIGSGAARSEMRASPWRNVSNSSRRVGSASAPYARSRHLIFNHLVDYIGRS